MSFTRTLISGLTLLGMAAGVLTYATTTAYLRQVVPTLPDIKLLNDWRPMEGTTILGSDGSVLGVHAKERRQYRPLTEMPDVLIKAFLAAEDSDYWSHSGVDLRAIARALMSNARSTGSRLEGGSTITQQVVKNVLLSSEQTFDRKIREAILALQADQAVGKERILEIYLNQIYFGSGAYGVDVAAETYFGKKLEDLTIAEAALLAGLPKSPSTANPFTNPVRANERRAYVLRRMFDEGFISLSEQQAAALEQLPSNSGPNRASIDPAMWYPQEAVRRALLDEVGSATVYGRGGTVDTSIDPILQRIVHKELRNSLVLEDRRSGWRGPISSWQGKIDWSSPALQAPAGAEDWDVGVVLETSADARVTTRSSEHTIRGKDLAWATSKKRASDILKVGDVVLLADMGSGVELVQIPEVQGAVVVMDPSTGAIKAMAGGFSHQLSEFDRSTQAKRQTGSVFKPFVFLAALEAGYEPTSPILDRPIALEQGAGQSDWRPAGGSGDGMGLITLRQSLELSRNMSTVRLLYDLGIDNVVDVATRAGLSIPAGAGYAMALGASEASPLEVATSYAAIANGGYLVKPYLMTGDAPSRHQVFDPVVTSKLSSMLEGVVTNGTARSAFSGFSRPMAAKTGTTNEARDAWFVAYGPEVVVVAWIGRDDHKPLKKGASGGSTAAPMVRNILDKAGNHISLAEFRIPENAATERFSRETGLPDPNGDVIEIINGSDEHE